MLILIKLNESEKNVYTCFGSSAKKRTPQRLESQATTENYLDLVYSLGLDCLERFGIGVGYV
jgi:hypothetical protein